MAKMRIEILICVMESFICSLCLADFDKNIELVKMHELPMPSQYYGLLDLRQYSETFYDNQNYLIRQPPHGEARLRLGAMYYEGMVDIYGTLGAIKVPSSQKVIQRRPEVEVDYYPISGEYGHIVFYNIVELPFSEGEFDRSNNVVSNQGTVASVGISPVIAIPTVIERNRFIFKIGGDIWTKLYSRRQYVDTSEDVKEGNESLLLRRDESGEPYEDYASPLYLEGLAGFSFIPAFAGKSAFHMLAYALNEFKPKYYEESGVVKERYGAERSSYYQIKVKIAINDRIDLINDFYHYHKGFFEARVKGEDKARYTNVLRLQTSL
ncbi:MAG: hypothetical protein HQK54_01395 [Oligoflexales bacterium]|nr:hypothetical protein [Oligoflexales bacterium]